MPITISASKTELKEGDYVTFTITDINGESNWTWAPYGAVDDIVLISNSTDSDADSRSVTFLVKHDSDKEGREWLDFNIDPIGASNGEALAKSSVFIDDFEQHLYTYPTTSERKTGGEFIKSIQRLWTDGNSSIWSRALSLINDGAGIAPYADGNWTQEHTYRWGGGGGWDLKWSSDELTTIESVQKEFAYNKTEWVDGKKDDPNSHKITAANEDTYNSTFYYNSKHKLVDNSSTYIGGDYAGGHTINFIGLSGTSLNTLDDEKATEEINWTSKVTYSTKGVRNEKIDSTNNIFYENKNYKFGYDTMYGMNWGIEDQINPLHIKKDASNQWVMKDIIQTFESYSFEDKTTDFKFQCELENKVDFVKNTATMNFKNIVLLKDGIEYTTKSMILKMTAAEIDQINMGEEIGDDLRGIESHISQIVLPYINQVTEDAIKWNNKIVVIDASDDSVINAGAGDDTVIAGEGNDVIIGGDGAGKDSYDGGAGSDTVQYTSATWGISVDLSIGTAASLINPSDKKNKDASGTGKDTLMRIENIIAGDFDDVLTGNEFSNEIRGEDGHDRINGRDGNDTLFGDAGDDTLIGGLGSDTLDGGSGADTASYMERTSAVIANLAEGEATIDSENDTLISIENLIGGKGADHLTGDGHGNILIGGAGNDTLEAGWDEPTLRGGDDTLRGGAGNDTYKIRKSTALYDDIVIDELADKGAGTDTLEIYEDLNAVGAPLEDDVTQAITLNNDGSLTNVFLVNGSQTGSFTIKGRVEFIRDHGIRDGDEFDILIQLWYGSTSIIPSESVVMTLGIGTTAEDKMNGTAKNDHIYGFAGADTLDGKGGGDKLFGGVGNDVYVWSDKYAGDTTISEESGNADQINLTTSGYINFETDDNGNVLINNFSSINGSLLGTLAYKAGTIERMNLILNGKSTIYNSEFLGVFDDPSTLDLSSGITNYIVVAKSDYEFKLGSGADFIIGDAIENVTVDAGAGNDFVNLSLAEDTTGSVLINGGIGADIMMGKAIFNSQRVTFIVDDTKDVVIARADGGSYVIRSSTSYSLNDITGSASLVAATGYVSSLELFGSASINGNGNKLNNTLTGSTGANKIDGKEGNDTLLGGAGNDTLIGGLGNDTLTGGAGNDRFVFDITLNATISNTDTITDFGVDTDKIVLSKSIFKFAKGMVNKDGTLNSSDSLSDYLSITGSGSTWSVAYDADGIGTKFQAVSFIDVTLTGLSNSLTATDFLVQ
jgi:Ca2+-binding RTX toxin-like protein